jgi:hypothetical protein
MRTAPGNREWLDRARGLRAILGDVLFRERECGVVDLRLSGASDHPEGASLGASELGVRMATLRLPSSGRYRVAVPSWVNLAIAYRHHRSIASTVS